jgi:DNA invertase Pin-like site-specific DNA recombinase
VDTLIVYKLDRLTRSVADLDRLMKLFERKGVALVSLQESLDATTATGRLMMNLLASVSQWEREVIGERTAEAMGYKKRLQEYTGGEPPYGWQVAPDTVHLEPCEPEQAIIRLAQGYKAQGWSLRKIGKALQAKGCCPRRGRQWHAETAKALVHEVAA